MDDYLTRVAAAGARTESSAGLAISAPMSFSARQSGPRLPLPEDWESSLIGMDSLAESLHETTESSTPHPRKSMTAGRIESSRQSDSSSDTPPSASSLHSPTLSRVSLSATAGDHTRPPAEGTVPSTVASPPETTTSPPTVLSPPATTTVRLPKGIRPKQDSTNDLSDSLSTMRLGATTPVVVELPKVIDGRKEPQVASSVELKNVIEQPKSQSFLQMKAHWPGYKADAAIEPSNEVSIAKVASNDQRPDIAPIQVQVPVHSGPSKPITKSGIILPGGESPTAKGRKAISLHTTPTVAARTADSFSVPTPESTPAPITASPKSDSVLVIPAVESAERSWQRSETASARTRDDGFSPAPIALPQPERLQPRLTIGRVDVRVHVQPPQASKPAAPMAKASPSPEAEHDSLERFRLRS